MDIFKDKEKMAKFAAKFVAEMQEKQQERKDFFESALCKRMISDIIQYDYCLDQESFAYFPEKAREALSWQDVSKEDVELFFQTMSEEKLFPVDKPTETNSEMFTEILIYRCGLITRILIGQGSIIQIYRDDNVLA